MNKIYPVQGRLAAHDEYWTVATFESSESANAYSNYMNVKVQNDQSSVPIIYFVGTPIPCFPEGMSLYSVLKEMGDIQ